MPLTDAYGRTIRDLRISLTDRCNFRCFYCLPDGEPPLARKDSILTFEEIERIVRIFAGLGIEKIRLTGGEPLLRKDLAVLVEMLAAIRPGELDLALTTNAHGFAPHAKPFRDAGLGRVTISLDSLRPERFAEITGFDALDSVHRGIDAAIEAGFSPVKINAVIVRGRNDDEVADLAGFAREKGVAMRFIEFMPLDSGHDWDRSLVVSGREIRDRIEARFPLELIDETRGSGTAWRYRFADGSPGEIGIIAPVTEMFCGACSRIRLTADGQIRTCLFSTTEHDLRSVLRSGASDRKVIEFIESVALKKEPSHRINQADFVTPSRSMSFIGG